MAYTAINKSGSHFKAKIYTGNGGTQNFTGLDFQPDFVWNKVRNHVYDNNIYDAVRGVTKLIRTNQQNAENTESNAVTAFNSDGWTSGAYAGSNESGRPYVAWALKANGQGSANTDGTINTTYTSANTTSGFSIIKYNGNGSGGATIGHGLGVAPDFVIIKRTDTTSNWIVGSSAIGFNKFLYLNDTATETTNSGTFNDTAPSSSVITLGTWNDVNNSSGTYICYAFANKPGFSKAGLYEGNNNADGTFVYTGFKPSFIMIKPKGLARNWTNWDDARSLINPAWNYIYPNLSAAGTNLGYGVAGSYAIDFVSNGFKLRNTDDKFNGSGQGMVYLAIGQTLVGSNNTPCTAR
jgi:hypothetical protein